MFRNKVAIKNYNEKLSDSIDLGDFIWGIASRKEVSLGLKLSRIDGEDILSIWPYMNDNKEEDITTLTLRHSNNFNFDTDFSITERDMIVIDGLPCFVKVSSLFKYEDLTHASKHKKENRDRYHNCGLLDTAVEVVTPYNEYFVSMDGGPYKSKKLSDLYKFISEDSTVNSLAGRSTNYAQFEVIMGNLEYLGKNRRNYTIPLDDSYDKFKLLSIYKSLHKDIKNNTYSGRDSQVTLENAKLQNAPVNKNKNQLAIESLISKYNLTDKLNKRITAAELISLTEADYLYNRFVMSKLSDDLLMVYRISFNYDPNNRERYNNDDDAKNYYIDYVAFLGEDGTNEASRNEAGYWLAKGPTSKLNKFFDSKLYFDNTLVNYSDVTKLKYVNEIIETLETKELIPFILNLYDEVYIESLLKGPLAIQALVMLKTLNLPTYRNVSNRVSAYYGRVNSSQSSLIKATGLTTEQMESIKGRYNWLSLPYPYWLKRILKPEEYVGLSYTSASANAKNRRAPSGEKFVSISEISIDVINESLDAIEKIYAHSLNALRFSKSSLIDDMIDRVLKSDLNYKEKLKVLHFIYEILRSRKILTRSSSVSSNINHFKDYMDLVDSTAQVLLEEEVNYTYLCTEPHIIDDRFRIMAELQDREKNALQEAVFTDLYESKWSDLEYERDDFIIVAPQTPSELTREGLSLNHCVASYRERVADSQTNILFIREKNNPDKPLYTLEVNNQNRVVQVRGSNNSSPTPNVQSFVESFKENKLR